MTEKNNLKPCPFCGGPVKLERATDQYSEIYGRRQFWGVICRNSLNLGGSCAIQQIPSASEKAAIERWNRRAPVPVAEPVYDQSVVRRLATQMGWTPPGASPADTSAQQAAVRTLERLGYTHRGGVEWAPPIGKAPTWALMTSRAEVEIPEGYALVPKKPTGDMLDAMLAPWFNERFRGEREKLEAGYAGMLAAAEAPNGEGK